MVTTTAARVSRQTMGPAARIPALFAALVILASLLVAISATPAAAADACPPGSSARLCTGTGIVITPKPRPAPAPAPPNPTKPGGGSGKPGGGGVGSGGGVGTNTWTRNATYWIEIGQQPPNQLVAKSPVGLGSKVFNRGSQCRKADDGSGRQVIGCRTYQSGYSGNKDGDFSGVGNRYNYQVIGTYTSIQPPAFERQSKVCVDTVGGYITGPERNGYGIASSTFGQVSADSDFKRSGYRNVSVCENGLNVMINQDLVHLGRYQLVATGKIMDCTIRHYTSANERTNVTPPDEVIACTTPREFSPARKVLRAEVRCDGWNLFYTNSNYTFDECGGQVSQRPSTWNCGPGITAKPIFAGVPNNNPIQVLADGTKRSAVWQGASPQGGVSGVRDQATKLVVDKNSTPWREGQPDANSPYQPFTSTRPLDDRQTGFVNQWDLGFQEPSQALKPWKAHPLWSFQAEFLVNTVKITTVNWWAGTVGTTTVQRYVTGRANCIGQPVALDVSRARNTNG